jgi:hydroxyacylglutathione hydrolase
MSDATKASDRGIRVHARVLGEARVVTIMTGPPWRENCHLVVDQASGDALLIDPGDRAEEILGVISAEGVAVRQIALTHGHHDHVGAVSAVCRALDLPCHVHDADLRLARQAPLWAFRFAGKKIEAPAPLLPLGESHAIGNTIFHVVHTPGHTAGGVCVVFDGFVFTGDTLLFQHVGRTDLPGGSAPTLRTSVAHLLDTLGDTVVVFAGHGRTWTIGEARQWWSSVGDAPPALNEHRDLT